MWKLSRKVVFGFLDQCIDPMVGKLTIRTFPSSQRPASHFILDEWTRAACGFDLSDSLSIIVPLTVAGLDLIRFPPPLPLRILLLRAQVWLPGEGKLSGISLIGRHEYPPNDQAYKPAPLKISVSLNGKAWTDVALFENEEMVFRVDLQGKHLKALHVRAERVPGPNEAMPFGCFHLRGFMVYGRKLYGIEHPWPSLQTMGSFAH